MYIVQRCSTVVQKVLVSIESSTKRHVLLQGTDDLRAGQMFWTDLLSMRTVDTHATACFVKHMPHCLTFGGGGGGECWDVYNVHYTYMYIFMWDEVLAELQSGSSRAVVVDEI
jgi:hypothetical protein